MNREPKCLMELHMIAKRLERKILAYPTQWYVFQMDWREQANNHENRYCN